jgi:hypothetical protein
MKFNFRGGEQQYDLPTAITFLMAGLGIGSLLAMVFAPRRASLPTEARPGAVNAVRGI